MQPRAGHAPTRRNAQGNVAARSNTIGNPGYATELSRLKKQWRKEWEAEQVAAARKRSDDAARSINAKLEAMKQRHLEVMSPRTRRLYEAYVESQRLDEQNARRRGED